MGFVLHSFNTATYNIFKHSTFNPFYSQFAPYLSNVLNWSVAHQGLSVYILFSDQ